MSHSVPFIDQVFWHPADYPLSHGDLSVKIQKHVLSGVPPVPDLFPAFFPGPCLSGIYLQLALTPSVCLCSPQQAGKSSWCPDTTFVMVQLSSQRTRSPRGLMWPERRSRAG